jgi:hypothetical protein
MNYENLNLSTVFVLCTMMGKNVCCAAAVGSCNSTKPSKSRAVHCNQEGVLCPDSNSVTGMSANSLPSLYS